MRSSTSPICSAEATASSSPSGSSSARSRSRWWPDVDDRRQRTVADQQPRRPSRSAAAWPTGRCAPGAASHSASSRSRVSARCAPRLSRATAWISSTITVSTVRSVSRPRALVTQQVERLGRGDHEARAACAASAPRCGLVVSPVRTATRDRRGVEARARRATVGDLAPAAARGSRRCRRPAPSAATRRRRAWRPRSSSPAAWARYRRSMHDQEAGERLARAGGRGDQRVAARAMVPSLRPALGSARRGSAARTTPRPRGETRKAVWPGPREEARRYITQPERMCC